jgi:outer membrane protein TolC
MPNIKNEICGLLVLMTCCLVPDLASARTYNFNDFYQIMISSNATYKTVVATARGAKITNDAMISRYIPSLSLTRGTTTTTIQDQASIFGTDVSKRTSNTLSLTGSYPQAGMTYSTTLYSDAILDTSLKGIEVKKDHSGNYSFSLTFSLLKGFGPLVGDIDFKQADITETVATLNVKKTLLTSLKSLLSSYLGTFTAFINYKSSEDQLSKSIATLKNDLLKFKLGKIPKLNILTQKTQRESLKATLLSQKKNIMSSKISLLNQAGGKERKIAHYDITALDSVSLNIFDMNKIKKWSKAKLSFKVLKNLDWQINKLSLKSSKLSYKQTKNNILPSLDLTLGKGGASLSQPGSTSFMQDDYTKNESITLSLSMPIGMISERAAKKKSLLALNASVLSFHQFKQELRRKWEKLKFDYEIAVQDLDIKQAILDVATERYNSSLSTASLGSTYQQNIVDYQTQLLTALQSLNSSKNNLFLSKLDFYIFHGDTSFLKNIE